MNAFVTLPRLLITLDGQPVGSETLLAITEIRVQERLGLPTLCELTLINSLLVEEPGGGWTLGAALRLELAEQEGLLFSGEVTAINRSYEASGGRTVRVRAYDLLHRLRKRQTVRAHVDVTVEGLAQELVQDLGLRVVTDASGPLWPLLIQHRQTDFELLAAVSRRAGLFPVVAGDDLRLVPLQGYGDAIDLVVGETLFEAETELNTDAVCDRVESVGWNALTVEVHRAKAPVLIGETGAEATETAPASGGVAARQLVNEAALDDTHAAALAQAEFDVRAASATIIRGVAEGTARLHAGMPVVVKDANAMIAGPYVATSVTHQLQRNTGFLTTFSSEPPRLPERPAGVIAAPGVVSRVDDPDRLGRIKVTLPTYGGVETQWMGVVVPGGGPGKGIVALPESGDQVLVLLTHEDPGQGVVLGGLYGMAGAPDDGGIVDGAVRRYSVLTPGGHRLLLDDARQAVRLEAANGSYVEFGPDLAQLAATTDLTIEAPGRALIVRARTVDFQQASEPAKQDVSEARP